MRAVALGRGPLVAAGFLCVLILATLVPRPAGARTIGYEEALGRLSDRSFRVKAAAIEAIATGGDERARSLLEGLLKGEVFYRKSDRRILYARKSQTGYRIRDASNGADLGEVGKREIKKVGLNNRLRRQLRGALAGMALNDPDPRVRRAAVREMMGDGKAAVRLRARLPLEQDEGVRADLGLAIALDDLHAATANTRLAAIATLGASLEPEVHNRLAAMAEADPDPAVTAAARAALFGIELRRTLNAWAETLFFGLSLGSVLVLAAIGLAITFGVMGVINMAHGELVMLGAYTTYLVQQAMPDAIGYSLLVAVPAAFVVSGLFGVAIERLVIRFLYGRPLETLLATFGISLMLQQLVRTTISAQNVAVENPAWMSGSLRINPALALTYNRLYIFLFAILVFLGLLLILKRTTLGLQVRAVSQNRAMARAMGIRSARVDMLTFGLGAGTAGVAGVALSQLTNVGPNMGQAYIIDSFMVVVFGGVGNLWGTFIGGLTLGIANKFMEPWAGAVLAKILVLIFIILFIQRRPRGLFPQRGRAVE
ncbi:MAG: urea ABC transporter permease subunit UrtB [Candidatus Thiosymbion ectosymbiont of Robbea hypermnestra]|nr:urea ABC transporter permease subunit UrtB [Candidatus Thiosymbion ectosymbiont of Robbea hypermnestra]